MTNRSVVSKAGLCRACRLGNNADDRRRMRRRLLDLGHTLRGHGHDPSRDHDPYHGPDPCRPSLLYVIYEEGSVYRTCPNSQEGKAGHAPFPQG